MCPTSSISSAYGPAPRRSSLPAIEASGLHRTMAKHIGIVSVSYEGAALCYRSICEEAASVMGAHQHPQITIHSFPLADYMRFASRLDWEGVAGILLDSVEKVVRAGADFAINESKENHANHRREERTDHNRHIEPARSPQRGRPRDRAGFGRRVPRVRGRRFRPRGRALRRPRKLLRGRGFESHR